MNPANSQIRFLIASALHTRKTEPDPMHIEPIHFRRWIESGLEWNVRICVIACLQFRPILATTQILIVKVRGIGKDTPTSRSYHVIIRGHAHILLFQSTLQIYSVDARIQIAVRTGFYTVYAS